MNFAWSDTMKREYLSGAFLEGFSRLAWFITECKTAASYSHNKTY